MIEIVGFILSAIATFGSISGSWYVSSNDISHRKTGFLLWLLCNPINVIVLFGVVLNMWSSLPLVLSVITQIYFSFTAYRGWKSNGGII